MTIFGKHLWHTWKDIYTYREEVFLGEKLYSQIPTKFRVCSECMKTQEFLFDSQGGFWFTLPMEKSTVLIGNMYTENGGWFLREAINFNEDHSDFADLSCGY